MIAIACVGHSNASTGSLGALKRRGKASPCAGQPQGESIGLVKVSYVFATRRDTDQSTCIGIASETGRKLLDRHASTNPLVIQMCLTSSLRSCVRSSSRPWLSPLSLPWLSLQLSSQVFLQLSSWPYRVLAPRQLVVVAQ